MAETFYYYLNGLIDYFLSDFSLHPEPLFASLLVSLIVLSDAKYARINKIKYLFSARIWLSDSTRLDVKVMLLNTLIVFSCANLLYYFATQISVPLSNYMQIPDSKSTQPLSLSNAILLSLFVALYLDLVQYTVHRAMHTIPLLWRFHKHHHSATTLTPLTTQRSHPVALMINHGANAIAIYILGVACFYSGIDINDLITVMEVNLFFWIITMAGGLLTHSHVWVDWTWGLNKLVVSPAYHQVHHSCAQHHVNKNYANFFPIWDIVFRSAYFPQAREKLVFGIKANTQHTIREFYCR
ncbi:sterol desaturase family protein [Pseudoalteromonas rubra]|uniref:sterol desaturase family protein n=1 Tax=Pseudoalteromonas rubra TaxID=43658 RepID=UPI000697131A|nr:sterol desaturase family protein [Pseudoalteromonas rubra]